MYYPELQKLVSKIPIYLDYYAKAQTRYQLHSPFIYKLIDFVFDKNRLYYDFSYLQDAMAIISNNELQIQHDAFSTNRHQAGLNIATFFAKTKHPRYLYECLYRAGLFTNAKSILELGSGAGLSGLALALSNKNGNVITIEGNKDLSEQCNRLYDKMNVSNIQCIHADFNEFLQTQTQKKYDLVFLDGDHNYKCTIDYIQQLIPLCTEQAMIIVDDIHWSKEMYRAWNEIKSFKSIHTSLELDRWGMLFLNNAITKNDFVYIPYHYKPWGVGVF